MAEALPTKNPSQMTDAEIAQLKMPYGRILVYLKPWLGRFILGVVLGIGAAAFNGVLIIAISLIFQLVLDGGSQTLGEPLKVPILGEVNIAELLGFSNDTKVGLWGVIFACACIPVLMFINGFLEYLNKYCLAWVGAKMLFHIRSDVFRSILRQSPAFFSHTKAGELMQTVFNQSRVAQTNAVQLVQLLTNRPLTIIAILYVLFAQDWFFTLMSLVIFPLCLAPIITIGRRVRKSGSREEKEVGTMMTTMHESFTGIRLVKAYARESYEVKRFDRANRTMIQNMLRWTRATELVGPIVESVASIGIAAGLVYFWMQQRSAGELIVLVMALTKIYPPAKELSKVNMLMQKTVFAVNKVVHLLDRAADIQDAPNAPDLPRIKGAVTYENVSFSYSNIDGKPLERAAVTGVHLELAPGKFYALVGPSGAGKSTLFSLLLRFYDPASGRVLMDGIDIKTVTQDSVRDNIGLVSQDTFLFHDTIRENIRYGRLDATNEEILAAAKKAHAHEFIQQIQGGYDAVVGDAGCNLSGGQKQRLSIARAILRNAPILLLDEATSALDTETEKIIQEAIHTLSEGKTVIAIAHRLSTIMEADQIVVMKDGQVDAVGSHSELLKTSVLYQKLYSLQFNE
ncbi:ATP-binding cassette, subfamily B, MsbA [Prosthecobacter debontii]|uniref:ATP-binding cassette, subfamily B, MsbA n=1 Tax=Prosthecobacter debontii TaxID=48467 RepID=A0A1T4YNI6_9BACT|nr:ABC transporter ATP-binding protein [Prosthecobacter debontii]SKB02825.1 ATP-binding cassette, subfamily B, MsbA [Prosthecobacter debontii]